MRGVAAFKERILKLNSLSIFVIIILYSVISFGVVYFILNSSLKRDIEFTKKEYFSTKKTIVKNQVLNFVNYINQVFDKKHRFFSKKLHQNIEFLVDTLSTKPFTKYKFIVSQFKKIDPRFDYFLLDSNLNVIYSTRDNICEICDKNEIKKIINNLKSNDSLMVKTYNDRYLISGKQFEANGKKYWIFSIVSSKVVHSAIKQTVKEMLYSVKFNKNKGYLSIIEIKNINGGKKYGKFVAIPIKPEWEGVYLNDNKKDAKGFEYRKKYLKLLRENGEGYFTYWFKGKDGQLYRKISYVKLYKPFNWAIVGGIYINEINNLVHKKEEKIKNELSKIFKYYLIISAIFLVIVYFITKYENKMLETIIDNYEKKIKRQNKQLKELNQNLQKEVDKKTKELLESYFIDPLTKLPNREKLLADLNEGNYIALLNIDSFKEINDFYGIEVGDEVLKKVAQLLKNIASPYKLAGDEFAFLDKDINSLEEKVKKVLDLFEKHKLMIKECIEIDVLFSVGIGKNFPQADMALKYAKSKKSSRVIIYNENLPVAKEYENNIKWKNIIKNAIKEDRVIPHVQPIVNAKNFETEKYECLIRIEHEGKMVSPFFFLDVSRKTGQYLDLQKIMIEKCFDKFSKLNYKFSINLSASELTNPQFKEFLIRKIEEYNVFEKLIIELLEDEALHNDELIGFLIYMYSELGIEFAIDDFGSGHSNLSYLLSKLPVSILKIDGSLVKNIDFDVKTYRLVKALTQMAKMFDLSVVAEFVENEEIAYILQSLGVDYLQGYYFGKPEDIRNLKEKE